MSGKPLDLSTSPRKGQEDKHSQAKDKNTKTPSPKTSPSPSPTPKTAQAETVRHSKIGDLHVLSTERNTVLYHGDDVNKPQQQETSEETDSFYEVTLDDVKSMYRDLQRRREELEGAPFKGQKLRALEKETAILKNLHDHPNTAIRIRFPDRHVLQGMFRTSDTIASVKAWLRENLATPSLDFYLFTAPPKKILEDEAKLVEEGLVAMVVIYFGSQNMPDNNQVLKKEHYSHLSDPEQVFELAKGNLKVRKGETRGDNDEIKPSTETQPKDHSSNPSTSGASQPAKRPVDKGKVPKWFKMK